MSAGSAPLIGPAGGMARSTRILLLAVLAVLAVLAASMIGRFGRGDRSTGYEPPEPEIASAAALRPLMVIIGKLPQWWWVDLLKFGSNVHAGYPYEL